MAYEHTADLVLYEITPELSKEVAGLRKGRIRTKTLIRFLLIQLTRWNIKVGIPR